MGVESRQDALQVKGIVFCIVGCGMVVGNDNLTGSGKTAGGKVNERSVIHINAVCIGF